MQRIAIFLCFLLSFVSAISFAESKKVTEIEAELTRIETGIQRNTISVDALNKAYDLLKTIQSELEQCVSRHKNNLLEIKDLVEEAGLPEDLNGETSSALALKKAQKRNVQMLSQCTFLLYKSQKLQREVNYQLSKKDTSDLFLREQPFYKRLAYFLSKKHEINTQRAYQFSGVDVLSEKGLLLLWGVGSACLFMILILGLRVRLIKKTATIGVKVCYKYLPWLTFFLMQTLFLAYVLKDNLEAFVPTVLLFSCFLLVAVITRMLSYFIVMYCLQQKYIQHRTSSALSVWVWGFLFSVFILLMRFIAYRAQIVDDAAYTFSQSVNLIIELLLFFTILQILLSAKRLEPYIPAVVRRWSGWFLAGLFFVLLFLNVVGYYKLSLFLIPNAIITLGLVSLAIFVMGLANKAYHQLNDPQYALSRKLRALTGVPDTRNFLELGVIRSIFVLGCILRPLRTIMLIWQVPRRYILNYESFFYETQNIFGLEIKIQDTLRAVVLFCIILLIGRLAAGFVIRKFPQPEHGQLRATLVAFINYVTFLIGLSAGLAIAGIDLSRFALVAGALSVGVGFGLKNITSDFLSGLLLLANPSIKPGDYVVIDNEQGAIKSISLLATTLTTDEGSDVIIPNSYLVSKTVKNHTHLTRSSMLCCRIQLEKLEDIEAAEQILLNIAVNCPGVLTKGRNKPSLELSLDGGIFITVWFMIDEINKKYQVMNRLSHAMVEELTKANIAIQI